MKLIQAIVCALSVSLVLAQIPTFPSTLVQNTGGSATVTANATVGTIVYLGAAGWVISSDVVANPPASTTAVSFVATLLYSTAATSIGFVATSGTAGSNTAACTPATAFAGKTSLTGLASTTATSSTSSPAACPADFVAIYSAAPAVASTTITAFAYAGAATPKLLTGAPVLVTITPTTTTGNCHIVAYTALFSTAANTGTSTCAADNSALLKYTSTGSAGPSFGFYVNSEGKAAVCLQTVALAQSFPGCGTTSSSIGKASSAGIVSVLAAPLLVLSAILLH